MKSIRLFLKKTSMTTAVILLFSISAFMLILNAKKWDKCEVLLYDMYGYHTYLPALFVYHDLDHLNFIPKIYAKYRPTHDNDTLYGVRDVQGKRCLQYPIGVAMFQAPLFLLTHAHTLWVRPHKADGYEWPYQLSVVLSTLLFAILGLIYLARFLQFYVSNKLAAATIFLIAFGTNFFNYATIDSGLSHIYLFFVYSALLYYTYRWYQQPKIGNSIAIGCFIGLAAILRPLDILIALIPLLWNPSRLFNFNFLKQHAKWILLIVVMMFVMVSPQLMYWKYITGHWLFYSYPKQDYFEFDRLRIIQGLFGFRKGWFLYTPIALIGCIALIRLMKEQAVINYRRAVLIFFIPMIYLVFAWHNWFYGWSFGCRALLQTLPLLALPLSYFLKYVSQILPWQRYVYSAILLLFISLNLFQQWQYTEHILHGSLMNETAYWRIFLKTKSPPEMNMIFYRHAQLDYEVGY